MKKILLPFVSHTADTSVLDFACYIARLSRSPLTGIFINTDPAAADTDVYMDEGDTVTVLSAHAVETDAMQSIRLFKDACAERYVRAEAVQHHHRKNLSPLEVLIHESRFADLLILDPALSLHGRPEGLPSAFAKEVLVNAECPVVVAPAVFDEVNELAFCYDGERASVFAMKQFSYLFPELLHKKLTVLEVGPSERITEKEKVRDWLSSYYPNIEFKALTGEPGDELLQYFLLKQNLFAVMGAYGRSVLSTFFKKSCADAVLRTVDLPLFITHPK